MVQRRDARRLAGKSPPLTVHHGKDCNKIPTAYKTISYE
ncbi:Unknown protein sequence [Pseudomonas syringae pv. cilantro]|uniref:Uncharacterized protein n=1 Tax=Pseudomonas syringae pv. cilantro TaxID=81035 RepID=A0A0N0GER2_PSESX|nr:Unknown protein sequence [Pseudomonas syringae pv. cilantro]